MISNPSHPTIGATTDLAEQLSVVLADPRRQRVLSVLAASPKRRSSFDDLAAAVTAFERLDEGAPEEPSSEVEVTLYHCHLPKLAEAGLVEDGYDEGDVELTRTGVECARLLDVGHHDQ